MARPTGFDPTEFGPSFGRSGGYAVLSLHVGTSHPKYSDNDIIAATNRRRIRHIQAHQLCDVTKFGFTGDGLRAFDAMPRIYLQKTMQYRFERLSTNEVRRWNQWDDPETSEDLSDTPNSNGEFIRVAEFVARRTAHIQHAIFGTPGSEIWYGGHSQADWSTLNDIWDEIESRLAVLESHHLRLPANGKLLRKRLMIGVDDFDDDTSTLLSSEWGSVARRFSVAWRDLRGIVEADVLDPSIPVDIQEDRKHVRAVIVNDKAS